jgi:hypothetical protein
MWPFRRRSRRGKHLLGAAVTGIPSLLPPPPPIVPAYLPHAVIQASPQPVAAPFLAPELPLAVVAPAAAAAAAPPTPAPRVELGFRDGSTASLAPGSEQAKALADLASVLTQRD